MSFAEYHFNHMFECTSTATAYHVHGCYFLFLSKVDYQDIPASLTCIQVIMTGKGREDDKGNSPRKLKPGDSPLTRGMCVGIAISMNASLHVASALIHCQCPMLSFLQRNELFCLVLEFKYCVTITTTRHCQQSDTHDSRQDSS